MELSEEEKEAIAWFLSNHWPEFSEGVAEFMTTHAVHRLASKLDLNSD